VREHFLLTLSGVLGLGIGAQWLAWRLRMPSILILLLTGFLAGPCLGLVHPDHLLGDLLFPAVSAAVAVILFEGGLTLSFAEVRETGRVIRRLITTGALITWILIALAAWRLLALRLPLALLLGAILTVTGPTVVGPLLRHVRPTGRVGAILKWEGILIDPLGATLAVLLFECILARGLGHATVLALSGIVLTLLSGVLVGGAGGLLLAFAMRRHWVPDFLQNALTLSLVLGVQALADLVQNEAGLLAVTVMGVTLANQRSFDVRHVLEFKKNLQVLLLAGLFIVLAARVQIGELSGVGREGLVFLALLIFAVRPAAVLASTWGSDITWRERGVLANLAPRGIVAAAVSAFFSMRLAEAGYEGAEKLASYTFLVIVGSVTFYALTARPWARLLGMADGGPQGVLILGAHDWARRIAETVRDAGFPVRLVDTNRASIARARAEGLDAAYANILSETALDELSAGRFTHFLALTSNPEVNALACHRLAEVFGRSNVYQFLAPPDEAGAGSAREGLAQNLRGRPLFGLGVTYDYVSQRFAEGDALRRAAMTESTDFAAFEARYGKSAVHMFVLESNGALSVVTADHRPAPRPGQTLVSLVTPRSERLPRLADVDAARRAA
jgi:NhaP-type Na+/H+ or K+/H+ antiporter